MCPYSCPYTCPYTCLGKSPYDQSEPSAKACVYRPGHPAPLAAQRIVLLAVGCEQFVVATTLCNAAHSGQSGEKQSTNFRWADSGAVAGKWYITGFNTAGLETHTRMHARTHEQTGALMHAPTTCVHSRVHVHMPYQASR